MRDSRYPRIESAIQYMHALPFSQFRGFPNLHLPLDFLHSLGGAEDFFGNEGRHTLTNTELSLGPPAIHCSDDNENQMNLQASHHLCKQPLPLWLLPLASTCPLPLAPPLSVNTHGFCKDSHKFWKLMCQEGQHGCEGAQSSSEEDEEGKFLLWVN